MDSNGQWTSMNSREPVVLNDFMPVVYVAGMYSDGNTLNDFEREKNRTILRYYSAVLAKTGWAVISPIENDMWAFDIGLLDYNDCIKKDLAIISKCDAIYFCPGWEDGAGARMEHDHALKVDIEIILDLHQAERAFHRLRRAYEAR